MRVCVIADDERLRSRIRQALSAVGGCDPGQELGIDQAESYLLRNKPEVIVFAAGHSPEQAITMVSRLMECTSGQLLAVGPVSDPRMVLGVLRGGAVDYVDESVVEDELAPALDRLKHGRANRANPGRLYAVVSPSGGGGASTVAANLAVAMAKINQRCLAIDLKLRSGDLAAMFDLRPTHTLQDVCRVSSRIDRVLLEQTLSSHPSGVSLLASPRSFNATISSEAIMRILELGRSLYPRSIVEIDPSLPEESLEALQMADSILVVLRLEFNSLRNAKAILEFVERQGVDPSKFLLVANRVGQPKEIPASKVEEALTRKLFAKIPDDPKVAVGSQNSGIPALTEYPSSRLSKTLLSMASALNALPATHVKGT